jgi:hypothetical protein
MKGNKNRKCEWNKNIQKNEQRKKMLESVKAKKKTQIETLA